MLFFGKQSLKYIKPGIPLRNEHVLTFSLRHLQVQLQIIVIEIFIELLIELHFYALLNETRRSYVIFVQLHRC